MNSSLVLQRMYIQGMKDNEVSYRREENQSSPLLRKGEVGGWKSYFTPEMNERFDKELLAKLKGTGLEFDFEK